MDPTVAAFLFQDGVITGAIYALLAVAIVLVFTVTRVVFVPQGEFVAFSALTMAAFQTGRTPGMLWLLLALSALALLLEVRLGARERSRTSHLAGATDLRSDSSCFGRARSLAGSSPTADDGTSYPQPGVGYSTWAASIPRRISTGRPWVRPRTPDYFGRRASGFGEHRPCSVWT